MPVDERLLAELVRENAQLRELLKNAGDRMLALAAPMERTARVAEEMQSLTVNEIREIRLAVQDLKMQGALIVKDIDDVQRDVREATGTHPTHRAEAAGNEAEVDKTIGKVVRTTWPILVKILPWIATGVLGIWKLIERLGGHHP